MNSVEYIEKKIREYEIEYRMFKSKIDLLDGGVSNKMSFEPILSLTNVCARIDGLRSYLTSRGITIRSLETLSKNINDTIAIWNKFHGK